MNRVGFRRRGAAGLIRRPSDGTRQQKLPFLVTIQRREASSSSSQPLCRRRIGSRRGD